MGIQGFEGGILLGSDKFQGFLWIFFFLFCFEEGGVFEKERKGKVKGEIEVASLRVYTMGVDLFQGL